MWSNTYNEIIKIALKPRSYLGVLAITVIAVLIIVAMKIDGNSYLQFLTSSFGSTLFLQGNIMNGNLISFIILSMLLIHIPLLIALVTGDLLSGEAAMGSMRLLATKPISRSGIVMSKFVAGAFYTLVVLVWLGFFAVVVSKLVMGSGDLVVLNSDGIVIMPGDDLNWRFAAAFGIAFLALLAIASLSLAFSAFADNSIGPIVSTMAVIILMTIIGTLDVALFDPIRPYLLTTNMAAWRSVFDRPIRMDGIWQSIVILIAHIGVFLGIALYKFNKKDILS